MNYQWQILTHSRWRTKFLFYCEFLLCSKKWSGVLRKYPIVWDGGSKFQAYTFHIKCIPTFTSKLIHIHTYDQFSFMLFHIYISQLKLNNHNPQQLLIHSINLSDKNKKQEKKNVHRYYLHLLIQHVYAYKPITRAYLFFTYHPRT